MKQSRNKLKVSPKRGALILIIIEILGFFLLYLSSQVTQFILQGIMFLVSMIVIWYASHPLAHAMFAKIFGVPILFFYVGRSEMGRMGNSTTIAKKVSPFLITIGTKLDRSKLSIMSRNRRAWTLGAGALVGIVILAIIESFAIASFRFGLFSLIFGGLFFTLTIGTELLLSTKSGDLFKMKEQFASS